MYNDEFEGQGGSFILKKNGKRVRNVETEPATEPAPVPQPEPTPEPKGE